jgi:hypothetical protein
MLKKMIFMSVGIVSIQALNADPVETFKTLDKITPENSVNILEKDYCKQAFEMLLKETGIKETKKSLEEALQVTKKDTKKFKTLITSLPSTDGYYAYIMLKAGRNCIKKQYMMITELIKQQEDTIIIDAEIINPVSQSVALPEIADN